MEDFVEIKIVKCERGPEAHRMPPHGEWQASFSFILSPPPDDEWRRLFGEVRAEGKASEMIKWLGGSLHGQRITMYCHPDQLQRYADQLQALVAKTNQYRRDMVQAGDKEDTRRREFEQAITSVLECLKL